MENFPEPDWKKLRALRPKVMDRWYVQQLKELETLMDKKSRLDTEKTWHQILKLTYNAKGEFRTCFQEWRRSTASLTLLTWVNRGLLTKEELEDFSQETKDKLTRTGRIRHFYHTENG